MICPRCQFYEIIDGDLCEICTKEFTEKTTRINAEILQTNKNNYDEQQLEVAKTGFAEELKKNQITINPIVSK